MAGPKFQPLVVVTAAQMRGLLFDTLVMRKLRPSAQAGGQGAAVLMGGDPNTFWQNAREHTGDIRDYTVEVSDDGSQWRDVTRGEFAPTFAPQRVLFPQAITTSHVLLTALSSFGAWDRRNSVSVPDKTAALAELAVLSAGPKLPDNGDAIQCQPVRSATPEIDASPSATRPPTQ